MYKLLLPALLVAGFSTAAKSEPTVYYCNTLNFVYVMDDEIQNIRSYPFKLFVDLENDKIKVAGEFANFEASNDSVTPWALLGFDVGEDGFFGNTASQVFDFQNNTFGYSNVMSDSNDELYATSIIARCDKF